MTKQELKRELMRYADGGVFITKSQIARAFGINKPTARINRIVKNLASYEKHYLISDVAEEIWKGTS